MKQLQGDSLQQVADVHASKRSHIPLRNLWITKNFFILAVKQWISSAVRQNVGAEICILISGITIWRLNIWKIDILRLLISKSTPMNK